ncbi:hypothetical protein F7725_021441 [Dissostichus mawsoni]|uniref:HAT C-terminal dimerisation domain-containing protein n=1 Tax=Dissostichus mawsoni TaxID=36200 RepID=A0A7J5ZB63_DISMA|nr:hypothetical protein F7725_021441 [Dissostichus mawsoni]
MSADSASDQPQEPIKRRRTLGAGEQQRLATEFFMENNLQSTFTETVRLLKILITTPMTTAESERCFSTLKRIKTFLRNTMSQ